LEQAPQMMEKLRGQSLDDDCSDVLIRRLSDSDLK
jgi:hypothetical protein